MEQQEVEFVNGLFVKPPREGAPDFVKGSISINRADLGNWLRGKQADDGWINIDVKESKAGKWYCSVNNWKPQQEQQPAPAAPSNGAPYNDDIPF
jgi:hypothetical protein